MLNWMKRLAEKRRPEPEPAAEAPKRERPFTGEYRLLYKYLANRYADTVVLTFGQIEDLLGFKLPDPARLRQDWWTSPAPPPDHTGAWILANRTARPNLLAQIVVFERGA